MAGAGVQVNLRVRPETLAAYKALMARPVRPRADDIFRVGVFLAPVEEQLSSLLAALMANTGACPVSLHCPAEGGTIPHAETCPFAVVWAAFTSREGP